ncbi:MAG: hypothetical protein IJR89_02705, partial [Clostridia bacterium]|nr:hypothetical protein [Clostridia bacterium]
MIAHQTEKVKVFCIFVPAKSAGKKGSFRMEKADFLDRVAGALAQRGVADAAILRYTEKTSALLDQLPPDELAAVLSERVDPDRFVAEMLADEPEPAPAPKTPTQPAQKPQAQPAPKPQAQPTPKPQAQPAPKPQAQPA